MFKYYSNNFQQIGTPGLLNSLQWVETEITDEIQDNEVEIQVLATGTSIFYFILFYIFLKKVYWWNILGVNFKDVMISMGMLNAESVEGGFCASRLGIECAGVVTKLGKSNSDLRIGDRVVAVAKNSYSSYL